MRPGGDEVSEIERGEPEVYEVVWMSGHVERVLAHQVMHTGNALALFGGNPEAKPRVRMHAELNGRWLLTLDALEDDIRTVRLVTQGERVPRG
jgi:hypothetical protein